MIKIGIVEDNNEERNKGNLFISHYLKGKNIEYSLDMFESSEAFLDKQDMNYNILFLDIQLPGMDGMNLAKIIRKHNEDVIIVFITNMAQFAIKGYEVEAFDFIVKPLNESLFISKMDRLIEKNNMSSNDKISFSINRQVQVFLFDEIMFIQTSNHDLIFMTKDGNEYKTRASLSSKEEVFLNHHFYRVSSYSMVNLRYVEGMDHDDIIIRKYRIRVSRPRKKEFLIELGNYLGKN